MSYYVHMLVNQFKIHDKELQAQEVAVAIICKKQVSMFYHLKTRRCVNTVHIGK